MGQTAAILDRKGIGEASFLSVGLYPSQMLVRAYPRSLRYGPFREGVMSLPAGSEASSAGQFTENETLQVLSKTPKNLLPSN
jgi:hypothetical protein